MIVTIDVVLFKYQMWNQEPATPVRKLKDSKILERKPEDPKRDKHFTKTKQLDRNSLDKQLEFNRKSRWKKKCIIATRQTDRNIIV